MREDIYAGLKNAVERGVPLEKAIQSFMSAGYREQEVREAARAFSSSQSVIQSPSKTQVAFTPVQMSQTDKPIPFTPIMPQQPSQSQQFQQPRPLNPVSFQVPPSKSGSNWLVFILGMILVFSLAAFVASLFFKQQIAQYISSLLG